LVCIVLGLDVFVRDRIAIGLGVVRRIVRGCLESILRDPDRTRESLDVGGAILQILIGVIGVVDDVLGNVPPVGLLPETESGPW